MGLRSLRVSVTCANRGLPFNVSMMAATPSWPVSYTHLDVYKRQVYDIITGAKIEVRRPDVLIVEGLNVLQSPRLRPDGRYGLAVSDFFDFSVYVDARTTHIRRWYIERFLKLRRTAFADPGSYFHRYASLSDEEAVATAARIWESINEPNLRQNVLLTRARATLVLTKGRDHSVQNVRLRKL